MLSQLFTATYRGQAVVVGQAAAEELAGISQAVETAWCRDTLQQWTMIAIRYTRQRRVDIHGLGWRTKLDNSWITSRLVAADLTGRAVASLSGHTYLLGQPDTPELDPNLRSHLAYALHRWAFENIRSQG